MNYLDLAKGMVMAKDKRIFKYELDLGNETFLRMPEVSEILDIQIQDGRPVMWAIVEPDTKEIVVKINAYYTGEYLNNADMEDEYISTIQHEGLVYHYFMSYEA